MKQGSWAGDVARMEKNRSDCEVFVGNPEELKQLGHRRK
jgi:hypothetical protein